MKIPGQLSIEINSPASKVHAGVPLPGRSAQKSRKSCPDAAGAKLNDSATPAIRPIGFIILLLAIAATHENGIPQPTECHFRFVAYDKPIRFLALLRGQGWAWQHGRPPSRTLAHVWPPSRQVSAKAWRARLPQPWVRVGRQGVWPHERRLPCGLVPERRHGQSFGGGAARGAARGATGPFEPLHFAKWPLVSRQGAALADVAVIARVEAPINAAAVSKRKLVIGNLRAVG
jgi:hypothetical protein